MNQGTCAQLIGVSHYALLVQWAGQGRIPLGQGVKDGFWTHLE